MTLKKNKQVLNYDENINELFDEIGGRINIEKIYNCVSRLRIVLKDYKKVDFEKLKDAEWNEGVVFDGKELQIILGKKVNEFSKQIYNSLGDQQAEFIGKFVVNENKKGWDKFISVVLSVIIPLIPYFLILGLNSTLNSLISTDWNNNGAVLTSVPFFEELLKILGILTRGINAAVPLLICWVIFRILKQPEILGIIVGLVIVLPTLFGGAGVISQIDLTIMAKNEGVTGNIFQIADHFGYAAHLFGKNIPYPFMFSFDGQVVPSILVAIAGGWICVGLSKVGSENSLFKTLFFNFVVVLLSFIVAMFFIAPLAFYMTDSISKGFSWLMTASVIRYIAPIFAGLTLPLLALIGLDNIYVLMGFIQYYTPDKNNLSTSAITTLGFFATYVMAGVAAYIVFVYSHKNIKELRTNVTGVISSGVGGVILPSAGINVNLRHLYPWISTGIGAGVGCLILAITETTTVLGTGSFLAILSTQNSSTMLGMNTFMNLGMLWMTIAIVSSILIAMLSTWLMGKIKWFKVRSQKILMEDYSLENDFFAKNNLKVK